MKLLHYTAFAAGLLLFSCDVDKQESGEMPDVDVEVQADEGELPEYDVDWANVNVGQRTKTMKVPKVMVVMQEEEVEVPYIDVSMQDNDVFEDAQERTIRVSAEVSEYMYELEIEKVYAMDNKLMVISELEKEDEALQDNKVRISDQIILNAPADLQVSHYVVGTQPPGDFNMEYTYIGSEDEIRSDLSNAQLIYED